MVFGSRNATDLLTLLFGGEIDNTKLPSAEKITARLSLVCSQENHHH